MKAKIAITVSALLLGTITTANADLYIQSPSGLTQAQWNATDSYKNFSCPAGYMRSEGVDMNFTITNADDFYYAECLPQRQFPPVPIFYTEPNVNVTPLPTPTQTETSTVTVTPSATTPVNNSTAAVTSETTTTVTETTTATSTSTTFESLYAQIMALFTQLMALIAKLKG